MSDEKKPGVRHVFDGIEELDNRLPNWWLGILWGTILFAFGYWFYYHPGGLGPSSDEVYAAEHAEFEKKLAASRPPLDDAQLAALVSDHAVVTKGAELYKQSCASCHAAEGQGLIGPNLTDAHWLYGARPVDIHGLIARGKVEKGMPAWEPVLGPERVKQLTAFVLTLKDKNVAGKEPQGERVQ